MPQHPPKILAWILTRLINKTLWESVAGDLEELFQLDVHHHGLRKAQFKYFLNAIAYLRYRRLRGSLNSKTHITMDLFSNYLKVSWRDIKRHKLFAAINMVGLVAGFASCLLLLQYVFYETSFDRFHSDKDRIYRVINDRYQQGNLIQHGTITYPLIGPTMEQQFPEVVAHTRLTTGGRDYFKLGDEVFMVNQIFFADQYFLEFFDFPVIHSASGKLLEEPNEVVLTASYATRFLAEGESLADLVGKTITRTGNRSLRISGILKDVPVNSHLQFEVLVSFETMIKQSDGYANSSWDWSDFYHYVKLSNGSSPELVNHKLAAFNEKYFKNGEVSGGEERFYLQPLSEAHLYSDFEYEIGQTSDGKVVWLMFGVAIFILLIAWINFVNLSTSRASERAKEIGLRKTLGALKKQVLLQSFAESFLINGLALLVALILVWSVQGYYADLTRLPIELAILWETVVFGLPFPLVFIAVFIGCLVLISWYPSLVLGRFKIQEVIRGRYGIGHSAINLRKGLVVFQFVATILMIIGSLTIYRQISFMQNRDLGMDLDNTLVLYGPSMTPWDSTYIENFDEFKHELLKVSGVKSVTSSSRIFSQQLGRTFQIQSAANPDVSNLTSNFIQVDHEFFKQYEINLIAGRFLETRDHGLDPNAINTIMINNASLKQYGFLNAEEAVGKKLKFWGRSWEIVGVVDDFHQMSLHRGIEPIMFLPYYGTDHYYSVKFNDEATAQEISAIQEIFISFYPGNYLDYFFLDDYYNRQYVADHTVKQIAQLFTAMAIIIALLGLYGLVLITMNRKTKEIAIRKVLGARLADLISSIGKEFLLIVSIAILIGLPLGYWMLNQWLMNYAYHVEVTWITLMIAALGLLVISAFTILFQTGKVSSNNPSDSLKYE